MDGGRAGRTKNRPFLDQREIMREKRKGKEAPRIMRVSVFIVGWVELGEVGDLCLYVLEGGFVGCWVLVGIGNC